VIHHYSCADVRGWHSARLQFPLYRSAHTGRGIFLAEHATLRQDRSDAVRCGTAHGVLGRTEPARDTLHENTVFALIGDWAHFLMAEWHDPLAGSGFAQNLWVSELYTCEGRAQAIRYRKCSKAGLNPPCCNDVVSAGGVRRQQHGSRRLTDSHQQH